MPAPDSPRRYAAALIALLAAALAYMLWPYASGLIGAAVLYVAFRPLHRKLARALPAWLAATLVIILAIVFIVGPGVSFATVVATEGQQLAQGVLRGPALEKLRDVRILNVNIGQLVEQAGSQIARFAATSALGVVGAATRVTVQLVLALFGLYYLLLAGPTLWESAREYIPFSHENTEKLRRRFRDITASTLIGTFLTAAVQGALVGLGFWVAGLPNALFWGVITAVLSILPFVGSGLIWIPGVIALYMQGEQGRAIGLAVWSAVVVANIDNVIRPWVSRRYAQLHPFMTILGAFAGVEVLGLLGLLVGPLLLSSFFELLRMYREEYLGVATPTPAQPASG